MQDYKNIFKFKASSEENEYIVTKKLSRFQSIKIGKLFIFPDNYAELSLYSNVTRDEFDYLCAEIQMMI